MYVCMHVCMYAGVCVYIYIYIYTYIHIRRKHKQQGQHTTQQTSKNKDDSSKVIDSAEYQTKQQIINNKLN